MGLSGNSQPASLSLADRFDGVLESGRHIASALTPSRIFEQARAAAFRLLRGEACTLIELDSSKRRSGGGLGVGYFLQAVGQGGPRSRAHISLADQLHTDTMKSLESIDTGSQSGICVPIKLRERTVACLCVTHSQVKNMFGPDEERLADFVATIAGEPWKTPLDSKSSPI